MDLDVMKWTVANDQIWLDRSDKNFVDYAKSIAKTVQALLQPTYYFMVFLKHVVNNVFIGYGLWLI